MRLRAHRKSIAAKLSLATVAALGGSILLPTSSMAAPLPTHSAQMADAFVDSIGVGTHLAYPDTPYGNQPLVKQRLSDLGVRHLRDGWGLGSQYASTFATKELAPLGIKFQMVNDPHNNATPQQLKEMVKSQMLPATESVESLNEWDLRGGDWTTYARNWTSQVSQAYRSDPATAHIKIVAPALAQTMSLSPYQQLGSLASMVDAGSTHDYPGNAYQMTDRIMDTAIQNSGIVAPGKPLYSTESGFSNGTVGAPYPAMPEAQVAQQLPKLFLDHYRRGIVRTYSYELLDEWNNNGFESRFGLVRFDGTPKPSYNALRNMISLLADKGTAFSPASLAYDLQGGDANTRSLLLQKRDGSYWLAVWQQQKVWDGSKVVRNPDVPVSLRLDKPVASAKLYNPIASAQPFSTASNTGTVNFASTEGVTLLELKGNAGGTTTPAPSPTPSNPVPSPTPSIPTSSPTPSAPAPAIPRTSRSVSDLPLTQALNAWGPVELDKSNGEQAKGDGRPLTVAGTTYTKGLGVHAGSDIRLSNPGASTFSATVGLDDESQGSAGSVVFQVYGDGTKLYDSGTMKRASGAKQVSVNITGRKELRLVVTDAGDGNGQDHADWAAATLAMSTDAPVPSIPTSSPTPSAPAPAIPRTSRSVSDLPLTQALNAWGPVELDKSNGEQAKGDGRPLTVAGTTYTKGLGVHAGSDIRLSNPGASTFSATVGLDDESQGSAGSVVFQVYGDGTKLYDSGTMKRASGAKQVSVNITGRKELRLVVTDAGDGNGQDHADWAAAKVV